MTSLCFRNSSLYQHRATLPHNPCLWREPYFVRAHADKIRSYSPWNANQTSDHTTAPNTPNYQAPSLGIENYLQVSHSDPNLAQSSSHTPTPNLAPGQQLNRQQYAYHHSQNSETPPSTNLRFIDSNPRPTKSPRHIAHPEVPSNAPQAYSDYSTRFAASYTQPPSEAMPPRALEYFPTTQQQSMSMSQPWTTGPESSVVYGTSRQPGVHHYEFPHEQSQYVKGDGGGAAPHPPMQYTWNPPQ